MIAKVVAVIILVIALCVSSFLLYKIYLDFYSSPLKLHINYTKLENQPSYFGDLQFYPDMRFENKNLSYMIGPECNTKKIDDMQYAFSYLKNRTLMLEFYQVAVNGDIDIQCGEEYKKGDFFVAGEGGPSTIVNTTFFSVILNGKILLLSSGECSGNVALHELLHVLGFKHSDSKDSIMYNLTSCDQVLTNDIVDEIRRLYSIEALPDLYFDSVNGTKKGSYLNVDFIVKNQGLKDVTNVTVILYSEGDELDRFELGDIEVGAGKIFSAKNTRVPFSTKSLKLIIWDGKEMSYENNEARLTLD